MTIAEMINSYMEINANLEPLLDHNLFAVRSAAMIQIDRNNKNIRELKQHLASYAA